MIIAHIELRAFLFSAARTLITNLKVMQACELKPVHVRAGTEDETYDEECRLMPAVLSFRFRCQRFLFVISGTVRYSSILAECVP